MRASTSAVPAWSVNAPRVVTGRPRPRTGRRRASNTVVERHSPGTASTWPLPNRSRSTPTRFAATRETGHASASDCLWVWSDRTRLRMPAGTISTSSPTCKQAPARVPVTTVPAPLIVNTRSRCSRPRASSAGPAWSSIVSRAAASASMPLPVSEDTGTIGASASVVPDTRSRISSAARSSMSSSTRSRFVSAITPPRTPSTSRICRCSSDCGFQPSSAATTNRTRRTGPTPASMLPMNRSWPGTSTKPISRPDGSVHHA